MNLRRLLAPDNVAVVGSLMGLGSLLLPWLNVKPNRVAAGTGLTLPEATGWAGAAAILVLWLVCLALSLTGKGRWQRRALGMASNLVLIATFVLAGSAAPSLSQSAGPVSRISPDAGFWLALVAVYLLIFASRRAGDTSLLWRSLMTWSGLAVVAILLAAGCLNSLSIMQELLGQGVRFRAELWTHIILFAGSVAAGAAIGIPLGIIAERTRKAERPIFLITSITETVPSLALFGLLIPPLAALSFAFPALRDFGIRGIGATPAIIALVIYSLLPIVRNTFVGLRGIDRGVIDAAAGIGMSPGQLFRRVKAPLAAPLVMDGVRTASVQAVGNAAVAALIGAGGLGAFIFQGFGQQAPDLILLGALPIIALAILVDAVMFALVKLVTPRGISRGTP